MPKSDLSKFLKPVKEDNEKIKGFIETFRGKPGPPGKDGKNGNDGKDGKTPKKGKDYFTESEKQEFASIVRDSVVELIPDVIEGEPEKVTASNIEGIEELIKSYIPAPEVDEFSHLFISELKKQSGADRIKDSAGMSLLIQKLGQNFYKGYVAGPGFGGNSGQSGGASPLTTKGDLYGRSTADARVPVGADGTVLTADSTQATGLKWTAVGGTGTVTNVASADGSVTVTNATTTPDLAIVKAPKLSTARTLDGVSFDGTANVTIVAPATHAATTKATPVDADEIPLADSAASFVLKKLTWANLKATLKTYFDTLYGSVASGLGQFASTTSAQLATVISDETGSGALVFGNTPTIDAVDLTGTSTWHGATSGTTTLRASSVAGTTALVLPAANDTLMGRNTTDTMTNKTLTSPVINTPTGIVKGDVGLGNVDNTSDATKNAASVTLTNKRNQPRTASSTTNATLTPDVSSANVYFRTTQTAGLTINAPTGTPVIGETIAIYVDSAGAQTLTIDSTYKVFGAAFPASTTAGKTFMLTAQYNGTDWKSLWANAI